MYCLLEKVGLFFRQLFVPSSFTRIPHSANLFVFGKSGFHLGVSGCSNQPYVCQQELLRHSIIATTPFISLPLPWSQKCDFQETLRTKSIKSIIDDIAQKNISLFCADKGKQRLEPLAFQLQEDQIRLNAAETPKIREISPTSYM